MPTTAVSAKRIALWNAGRLSAVSPGAWNEAVQRGQDTGWIDLIAQREEALRWLETMVVPDLTRARLEALLPPADEAATVARSDGPVRRVSAWVAIVDGRAQNRPQVLRKQVHLLATSRWVVTIAEPDPEGSASPQVTPSGSAAHANGADLALRILLSIAETQAEAVRVLSASFDADTATREGRTQLLRALNDLETVASELRRRGQLPATAWFRESTQAAIADGVAEVLDETLERVASLRLQTQRREDEERNAEERRRAGALQLILGTIAAVLLGPSLVAAAMDAFPGWQPVPRRMTVFIGLATASAGALWLVGYAAPVLVYQRVKPAAGTLVVLLGVGVFGLGLVVALPLRGGSDESPPTISVTCPEKPVPVGSEIGVLAAAADAESSLTRDPSGSHPLKTEVAGVHTAVFRATDSFGRAASASCTYRVVARRKKRKRSAN